MHQALIRYDMPFKIKITLLSTTDTNIANSKLEWDLIETNVQECKETTENSHSFILEQLNLNVVYKRLLEDAAAHERNQNIETVDIFS